MSKDQIKELVRQAVESDTHRDEITKVSLFGSHARGNARPDSDVDLLIEFRREAEIGFFDLSDIEDHIKKYVKKNIDLLTPEQISRYFRLKSGQRASLQVSSENEGHTSFIFLSRKISPYSACIVNTY